MSPKQAVMGLGLLVLQGPLVTRALQGLTSSQSVAGPPSAVGAAGPEKKSYHTPAGGRPFRLFQAL